MQTLLILTIALVSQATQAASSVDKPLTARDVHELRREVSELLRRDSGTSDEKLRAANVRRMTEVYREVLGDPRLLESPTLQQQKIKLWTRMTRVRDEIRRKLKIEARQSNGPDEDQMVVGELATHLQFASQTLGGPSVAFSGGGIIVDDFGDELIELITRTIDPDHWDTNGGPGSMFYYRPLMALVVRARSEVHHELGGVLGGLRP